MKRWFCGLLLTAVLLPVFQMPVLAEELDLTDICWTTRDDAYYHMDEHCGGAGTERYPLSVEAALAFEKAACPVCAAPRPEETVPATEDEILPDIQAAERGGTWVFRVPADRLFAAAIAQGSSPERELDSHISANLPALFDDSQSNAIEARIAIPAGDSLLMNLRVIEGDAYLILRPEKAFSDERPMTWQAEALSLGFFGEDEYAPSGVSDVQTYAPGKNTGDYTQVFNEKYGKIEVAVYRTIGANVAVLYRSSDGEDALKETLRIDDMESEIVLTGYRAKKTDVFCCVITDAELGALVAGAKPALTPIEVATSAEDEAEAEDQFETESNDDSSDGAEDDTFAPVATLAPAADANGNFIISDSWSGAEEE